MHKLSIVAMACVLLVLATVNAQTQKKSDSPVSQLCTRTSALDIIQQQNAAAKSFDNVIQRIAVTLRAADLLWPYQQAKARAAFMEAFDLATADYKEKGEQTGRDGKLSVSVPDQRFLVIGAIAKRDSAWARKLTEQALQDARTQESETTSKDPAQLRKNAEKLMGVALALIQSDPNSSLVFARSSLRYPATLYLPLYLYRLATKDKSISDALYQEALAAYSNSPMEQFLYLSSYPFANNREAGEMPGWMIYDVPSAVTPNQNLQRAFMQALLRQAQTVAQGSTETRTGARYPEAAQIWMALSRLERQVQSSLPDLFPAVQEAKGSMFVLMSQKEQQRTAEALVEPPKKTFDEQIEAAEKQTDPGRREGGVALAILGVTEDEPLEHVVAAADKIDDVALRQQVLSRFYFNRAQAKLKKNEIEDARKLASKVENLDHRAYLYSRIVSESMKASNSDGNVRDILEEVVTVTTKAPNTEIKARALLAIAYLFANIDAIRSISVLGDAIKTINQIENPDFSRDYILTRIEGKQFGFYSQLSTPGFNPENTFREMGKFDFDGLFYQASQFTNKSLRTMTTMALVEPCLLTTTTKPNH